MVNVTIDNNHVAAAISGSDEFFITPKKVDEELWSTEIPNADTSSQPVTVIETIGGDVYVGTENPHSVKKLQSTDGSKVFETEIPDFTSKVKTISEGPNGEILATDEGYLASLTTDGDINWTEPIAGGSMKKGVGVTQGGNIVVNGKIISPDGTVLQTWDLQDGVDEASYMDFVTTSDGTYGLYYETFSYKPQYWYFETDLELHEIDVSDSASAGDIISSINIYGFDPPDQQSNMNEPYDGTEVYSSTLYQTNDGRFGYSVDLYTNYNGFNDNAKKTGFVSGSLDTKTVYDKVVIGFSQDSDGYYYGINESVVKKYENDTLSEDLSNILYEYNVPNEVFELKAPDNFYYNDENNKTVVFVDLDSPTISPATYKLFITSTSSVTIDGTQVTDGTGTNKVEMFVDSGTKIDGDCFISGVQVK